MPLPRQTLVGPPVAQDGAIIPVRGGKGGEQIVSELQGRYYEQAYRGNTYVACNTAAGALTVGIATTYTGLSISNPIGNTKNLVMIGAGFALTATPGATLTSINLIGGFSATANVTHGTPLAAPGIQNLLLGTGPASTAKADSASTLTATPSFLFPLAGAFTASTFPSSPMVWLDLSGQLILPPGAYVAVCGSLAALTGIAAFTWAEVVI